MSFTTLMYHEIREAKDLHPELPSHIEVKQGYGDILPPPLFVTLEHFREQMAYLHENQYRTLTLDEVKKFYFQGGRIPEKSVLLTFDDCFQSVKKYAYPILKEYGFHAVAFVVTGWLWDEKKEFDPQKSVCMAEEELAELEGVFEFANHTDSLHRRTSQTESFLMTASDEEISEDLDRCNGKAYLNNRDVFAYPFGLFSESNLSLLQSKGFRLAFTSDTGRNSENDDPLRLKRNAVPYFMELEAFRSILEGERS